MISEKEIDELINKALQDESSLPEGIAQRLEKHIDHLQDKDEKPHSNTVPINSFKAKFIWLAGIAASFMLIMGIGIYQANTTVSDVLVANREISTDEASELAAKSLMLMSSKLNQGLAQASSATAKVQEASAVLQKFR